MANILPIEKIDNASSPAGAAWLLGLAVPAGLLVALGWLATCFISGSPAGLPPLPLIQVAENPQPVGAEFFGVKATGKRFIFIVDASGSMRGEKFEAAKRELKAAVERLTADQSFNVAFFNTGACWMFQEAGTPQLIPATGENVLTFARLLDTVQLGPNTEPAGAIMAAVKIAPDAVYLLSDGKFTDKGLTHRWLKGNNVLDPRAKEKKPKVMIHTIAFHNHDSAEGLRSIAAGSGGTYRFVPSPAEAAKKNIVPR